jgi:glycosyltransferase involved in cell wall biosynthesis
MKRLLLMNWRDVWHPKSGGAELVTLRLLEGLAARGWSVEWFSGGYAGAPLQETRNGVHYVRAGTQLSVHVEAYRHYSIKIKNYDVVVDEINTVPFFAPLYSSVRTFAFIPQLAQEVWSFEMPRPLGAIGRWLEPFYLAPYRKARIITISKSSAQSLRSIGLMGRIDIIPMAVDEAPDAVSPPKSQPPDVVVICRMTPSKRVEHAIRAASLLSEMGWSGTLHLVGGGSADYMRKLRRLAAAILGTRVVFHGRVSNDERSDILRKASVLWLTSVREGWGLVVTEAGRHWTPAVVYDVPGLQDSVVDNVTGKVVPPDPAELAKGTHEILLRDYPLYARRAFEYSGTFSWERTIDAFESILESES